MTNNNASTDVRISHTAPPKWLLPSLIVAALVAGVIGEYFMEQFKAFYFTPEPGLPPQPEWWVKANRWDMMRNHAIGFGIFGCVLVGLLGFLVGLAKNPLRAPIGLLVGGALGLIAGGGGGPLGYLVHERYLTVIMEGMLKATLIFGPLYLLLALATTLATVLIRTDFAAVARAVLLGFGAGVAALIAYNLLALVIFPVGRPEEIVPMHTGIRYTSFLAISVICAVASFLVVRPSKSKATAAEPVPEDASATASP